jgi:integrase
VAILLAINLPNCRFKKWYPIGETTAMPRKSKGRKRGSRNKGFFYRRSHSVWCANVGGKFVPLTDERGMRLKAADCPLLVVKDAYGRFLKTQPKPSATCGATLEQVCNYYLSRAKTESRASTVEKRADTLFDLCYGLPARWRPVEGRTLVRKPTAADKIHPGYGSMTIAELRPHHLEDCIDAHKGWASDSGRKTRLQAVKRALNRAARGGLIPKDHPIRGMFVPRGRARVTYITDQQEQALLETAGSALKLALRVLIRTGMRPGCEFAKLTAASVVDHGERLELHFKASEAKNNRARIIRIKEKWLIDEIRKHVNRFPDGPLFRNSVGGAWEVNALSRAFRRALDRAKETGVEFDDDVCLYSCRHTFAKRALIGYWTDKPINMELLASLMGNTPKVCAEHYADILKELSGLDELLWAAC